jgi:serpin B
MLRYLPLLFVPVVAIADSRPASKPPTAPFAAQLDGQLAKRSGNFLYSPSSISIALAMAREGARGQTADEMDRVLGATNGGNAKAFLTSFKTPAREPGGAMPPELSVANRIFVDAATTFESPFLEVTSKDYLAPAQLLDFREHAEHARVTINQWVAGQTHDKIKDLLAKGTVNDLTRMVLVNAIYLKAQWATPFPAQATTPAPFAIADGKSKQVTTMHTVAHARWGDHAGARMLDLPYASAGGPQLGMLLVVPDGKDLAAVEAAYAQEGFAPFMAAVKSGGKADVALPRFEIGTTFELANVLADLGIQRAFSDDAQFAGISKLPTKISKVIHKAWAKVDEKGTEAAAATAVVMTEITSIQIDTPHPFKVDRAFLFFIHDDKGNVLFAGRIMDPSQS